ncbi:DUF4097 family beta strand repeat-containing protein [Halorhabdus utahensis]|nr:DUF4097 family beta strand repeat-containing protein [Halorhabdus utahensis]
MTERTRRDVLAGGAIATLAGLSGCSGLTPFVGKRIEGSRTIDPAGANEVGITVEGGDVQVTATDRSTIDVAYIKKSSSVGTDLSKLDLRSSRSGDRVHLHSEWAGGRGLFDGSAQLDIDAKVPASMTVDRLESGVGDVSVTGMSGPVRLRSRVGDVTATAIDGDVDVRSNVGDAIATDVDGSIEARTSTGDVEVSGGGTISDLQTNTGDIEADVPAIDGPTSISTDTGDPQIRLATDIDVEILVKTGTGDLRVEGLSLSDLERAETMTGTTVRGTLGDGGPTLRIETDTGDVTVEPLS